MQHDKLRHIVLFGFRDSTTQDEIDAIVRRFVDLAGLIPGIEAFEWGVNNSPEGIARGHTHCFVLTFASAEARDAYLPHLDHQSFVGFASPNLENVLVVDYWAQDIK